MTDKDFTCASKKDINDWLYDKTLIVHYITAQANFDTFDNDNVIMYQHN